MNTTILDARPGWCWRENNKNQMENSMKSTLIRLVSLISLAVVVSGNAWGQGFMVPVGSSGGSSKPPANDGKPGSLGGSGSAGFAQMRINSTDGRFTLRFKRDEGVRYKIVEVTSDRTRKEYQAFGRDEVSFFKPRNGRYQYMLEACRAGNNIGLPGSPAPLSCATEGSAATVSIGLSSNLGRGTCNPGDSCGGVDQLQPGQWWNPAKEGHGWDVYWVNDLNGNNNSSNPYELYVLWYTYREEQNVEKGAPKWHPAWLIGKLQEQGGNYTGDLHYCQKINNVVDCETSNSDAGDLTVTFAASNTSATFAWNLDNVKFPGFPSSGTDSVEFFGESLPSTEPGPYSHFNGIWNNRINGTALNPDFNFSEFMREDYWSTVFSFYDNAGEPVWVKGELSGPSISPGLKFGVTQYVTEGYSPAWNKPGTYTLSNYQVSSGGFFRQFFDVDDGDIYSALFLPSSRPGTLNLGSYSTFLPLEKQTGASAIWFDVNGDPTVTHCSTYVHGSCALNLGWSLDNDATASVYDNGVITTLVTLTTETTQDHVYSPPVDDKSHHFTLHAGTGSSNNLLAQSATIRISNDVISPTLTSFTVVEGTNAGGQGTAAPGQFGIDWAWSGEGTTWFDVEYKYGPNGQWTAVSTINVFQADSSYYLVDIPVLNADLHYYRIKACNATECTVWSETGGMLLSTTSLTVREVAETQVGDTQFAACLLDPNLDPDNTPASAVTSLGCIDYPGITDLTGLNYFRNLQSLWLYKMNLTNVQELGCQDGSPIVTCFRFLDMLTIDESTIPNLAGIGNLENLTHLTFTSSTIGSLQDIQSPLLDDLIEIRLQNTNVSNYGDFSPLPVLRNLIMDYSNIWNLDSISSNSLEYLNLGFTNLTDISGLSNGSSSNVPALDSLLMSPVGNLDLDPLLYQTSLTTLGLFDNLNRHYDYLDPLNSLTFINVGNKAKDLTFVENKTDLGFLSVSGDFEGQNAFENLSALINPGTGFSNIGTLWLSGTAENVDISPLVQVINAHVNAPALSFSFNVEGVLCSQQDDLVNAFAAKSVTYTYDPTKCNGSGNGIQSVTNARFEWVDEEEGQFRLIWSYPESDFNTETGRPFDFRVFHGVPDNNPGGLLGHAPVPEDAPWQENWHTTTVLDKDEIFGDIFEVKACNYVTGPLTCSPAFVVQLVDSGVEYMPIPNWNFKTNGGSDCPYTDTATHSWPIDNNEQPVEFHDLDETDCELVTNLNDPTRESRTLVWDDLQSFHEDVDYYQIEEKRYSYRDTSPLAGPTTYYYSDKPSLEFERSKEQMYRFRIRSCNRNRDSQTGDVCSEFSKAIVYNLFNPGFSMLDKPINEGWFVDGNGHKQLTWSVEASDYQDHKKSPDYFVITGPGNYLDTIITHNWRSSWQTNEPALTEGTYDIFFCQNTGGVTGGPGAPQLRGTYDYCGESVSVDTTSSSRQLSAPVRVANGAGGPGDLKPGEWWDEDRSGTGWSFYWASDLRYSSVHEQYGDTYDLIAVWFAYKKFDGDESWRPVWYYSQLKFEEESGTGDELYQGNLLYPQANGDHIEVGSLLINFSSQPDSDNQTVDISVKVNEDGGMFVDEVYNLEYFANSSNFSGLCTEDNEFDHFSGMWWKETADLFPDLETPTSTPFVMTDWIVGDFEALNIAMYDANGEPAWVRGQSALNGCGTKPGLQQTLTLSSVLEGFDPNENTTADFFDGGIISQDNYKEVGTITRTYQAGSYTSGTITGSIDISDAYCDGIPGCTAQTAERSGTLSFNVNNNGNLNKTASFHDIRFFVDGHIESTDQYDECSTNTAPENDFRCELKFTWFTDGDYTNKQVVYEYMGSAGSMSFIDLCSNSSAGYVASNDYTAYVEDGFQCDLMDNAAGDYQFFLQKQNMGTTPAFSTISVSPILTVNTNVMASNSTEPAPSPASMPSLDDGDPNVGSLAGQFSVSASGAATYSVPIYATAGTGGLTPTVTLNYNSAAGNGPMGVGWTIGGPSMISRCPQTIIHDGQTSAVIMDDTVDRLCMDGQRLIQVAGTGGYFGTSAQYRTEVDRYINVRWETSFGHAYLVAELPDGSISSYGRDAAAGSVIRADAGDEIFAWAQDAFIDTKGNFIRYEYEDFAGSDPDAIEFHLKRVKYTGHDRNRDFDADDANEFGTYAEILFNYQSEDREDHYTRYLGGIAFTQTRLLDSVQSWDGANILRHYNISYDTNGDGVGRSIVTQLQECADSTGPCYDATTFEWNKTQVVIDPAQASTVVDTQLPQFTTDGLRSMRVVDFDGSGRQDLVYADTLSGSGASLETIFGAVLSEVTDDVFTGFGSAFEIPPVIDRSLEFGTRWAVIDYDANGFQDIIYARDQKWHAIRWNHEGTDNTVEIINDIGTLPTDPANQPPQAPEFYSASDLQVLDANADGYPDLVYIATEGAGGFGRYISYHNGVPDAQGNYFGTPVEITLPAVGDPIGYEAIDSPLFEVGIDSLRSIEMNGDGAADLLTKRTLYFCPVDSPSCNNAPYVCGQNGVICHSAWYTHEADPQGGFNTAVMIAEGSECDRTALCTSTTLPIAKDDKLTLVDINADGLSDLLYEDATTAPLEWKYHLNVGLGVFGMEEDLGAINEGENIRFADIDGNGFLDLMYPSPGTVDDNRTWQIRYWKNDGYGTADPSHFKSGDINDEGDTSIFMDANGDGMTDHLFINRDPTATPAGITTTMTLGFNALAAPAIVFEPENVVTKITDGLGAEIIMGYKSMAQRSVYTRSTSASETDYCDDGLSANQQSRCEQTAIYDFIAPAYLVSEVTTSAPGMNSDADVINNSVSLLPYGDVSTLQYYYTGAKVQTGGRGSLGFEFISTFNPQNNLQSTRRFSQVFPTIGRTIETRQERLLDGAVVFPPPLADLPAQGDVIDPCLDGTGDSCAPPPPICPPDVTCGNQRSVTGNPPNRIILSVSENSWTYQGAVGGASTTVVPYLQASEQHSYNPDNPSTEKLSSVESTVGPVDIYSNPVFVTTVYKRPDPNNTSQDETLLTQFVDNHFDNNPNSGRWQIGLLTQSMVTSNRASNCTGVCNITRQVNFEYDLEGVLETEILEEGAGGVLELVTDYTIDSFGNRTGVTVRNGADTESFRQASIVFDSTHHRFVDEQMNAYGQVVSEVTTRDKYGNPTQVIDLLGNTSTLTYDPMGRPQSQSHPSGVWSHVAYIDQNGATPSSDCPAGTSAYVVNQSGGSSEQISCLDVLGRVTRSVSIGFDGTPIYQDVTYDALGRTVASSQPYFQTDVPVWSFAVYDAYSRTAHSLNADDALTSHQYDGLVTSTLSPRVFEGQSLKRTETRNILGELIQVTDNDKSNPAHLYQSDTYYQYNAVGELTEVTDALGNVQTMGYNLRGHKTYMDDPDMGEWVYGYDALGQLKDQESLSENQQITFGYDLLGRITDRTDQNGAITESESSWTYNNCLLNETTCLSVNNFTVESTGQLALETMSDKVDLNIHLFERLYAYDLYGRASQVDTHIRRSTIAPQETYTQRFTYDEHSRPFQSFDAAGDPGQYYGLRYHYNSHGYLSEIRDSAQTSSHPTGRTYATIGNLTSRGQLDNMTMGNLVTTSQSYDVLGRVDRIMTSSALGVNGIQDLSYGYDIIGNLSFREDHNANKYENFYYDALNRLNRVDLSQNGNSASTFETLGYNKGGNLECRKSSAATSDCLTGVTNNYTYGQNGAGAHAASSYTPTGQSEISYGYDSKGNMISKTGNGNSLSINYSEFNKPEVITELTNTTEFFYDSNRSRYYRRDWLNGNVSKETLYVGNVEIITENGQTEYRRNIAGVAIVTLRANGDEIVRFTHRDHLGSVEKVTDENGYVVDSYSFDAFGLRRNPNDWADTDYTPSAGQLDLTQYGFTDHEHIDSFGIIHMNGRIYDPELGRMMQADPFVQAPLYSQSFNRFSYVFNNPLTYSDPSGYMCEGANIPGESNCSSATPGRFGPNNDPFIRNGSDIVINEEIRGRVGLSYGVDGSDLLNGNQPIDLSHLSQSNYSRILFNVGTDQFTRSSPQIFDDNSSQISTIESINSILTNYLKIESQVSSNLRWHRGGGTTFRTHLGQVATAPAADGGVFGRSGDVKIPEWVWEITKGAGKRLLGILAFSLAPSELGADSSIHTFFHGTDFESGVELLNGAPLSVDLATDLKFKRDGATEVGFYLTDDYYVAVFFANRRNDPAVLLVTMSGSAYLELQAAGAVLQPIPRGVNKGSFPGKEFVIPASAFPLFDSLRASGKITIQPAPIPED